MNGLAFFDTNILLYADDRTAGPKRQRAIRLLADHLGDGSAIFSLQVLQEYYAAATRKLGVDPEIAQRKVEILARARVIRLSELDLIRGIELHRFRRIAFWDALIVVAAQLAGCAVLYSEDSLGGGQVGGLPIVNPFR